VVVHPQLNFCFRSRSPHIQFSYQSQKISWNIISPKASFLLGSHFFFPVLQALQVLQASCRSVKGLLTGPVVTVPLPTPAPLPTPGAEAWVPATRSCVPAATEPTGCAPGGKGARRSALALSLVDGLVNVTGLVEGKIYRKPWFLPSNIGFSCKFSHHPILWEWIGWYDNYEILW
jgi:hypothetical protein